MSTTEADLGVPMPGSDSESGAARRRTEFAGTGTNDSSRAASVRASPLFPASLTPGATC